MRRRASPGSGSRGLGTRCRAKVRAARVRPLGRERGPLRLTHQHWHYQNPPTHLRLAGPASGEVRGGVQNWKLAAGVGAAARARLGPAAKQILPPPTRAAPGSDSRTPGHSHAHTLTRSLTHTHSPQVQNRPVPWRVAGWGRARRIAGAPSVARSEAQAAPNSSPAPARHNPPPSPRLERAGKPWAPRALQPGPLRRRRCLPAPGTQG